MLVESHDARWYPQKPYRRTPAFSAAVPSFLLNTNFSTELEFDLFMVWKKAGKR